MSCNIQKNKKRASAGRKSKETQVLGVNGRDWDPKGKSCGTRKKGKKKAPHKPTRSGVRERPTFKEFVLWEKTAGEEKSRRRGGERASEKKPKKKQKKQRRRNKEVSP